MVLQVGDCRLRRAEDSACPAQDTSCYQGWPLAWGCVGLSWGSGPHCAASSPRGSSGAGSYRSGPGSSLFKQLRPLPASTGVGHLELRQGLVWETPFLSIQEEKKKCLVDVWLHMQTDTPRPPSTPHSPSDRVPGTGFWNDVDSCSERGLSPVLLLEILSNLLLCY